MKSSPPSNSIIKLKGYDNVFFTSCPVLTFKVNYDYGKRVKNGDLKYLLVESDKLDYETDLPIYAGGISADLEGVLIGMLDLEYPLTPTEIAHQIKKVTDVQVYVYVTEEFVYDSNI